jgi:hypothetical protein
MSARHHRGPRLPKPANDNARRDNRLSVVLRIPQDLPIQRVEVEVFAQLLDSLEQLAANDNQEPQE